MYFKSMEREMRRRVRKVKNIGKVFYKKYAFQWHYGKICDILKVLS